MTSHMSPDHRHRVVGDDARIAERIGKLFAQADSVVGTPEAEVFLERAYALLARHGIDEVLARGGGGDGAVVEVTGLHVSGPYRRDRVHLVACVVRALHCQAVVAPSGGAAGQVVTVVGAGRHVRRIRMLVGHLCGLMLATAAVSRPDDPRIPTTSHRKSFMAGFAWEVYERLAAAESHAVHDSTDSGAAALVLADDSDRAAAELRRLFPWTRPASRRTVGVSGIDAGRQAAAEVDLGQSRVDGSRRALAG